MQWLVVKNEIIENIVVWDGVAPWTPPEGCEVIAYEGEPAAHMGWGWVNGQVVVPPEYGNVEQREPTIVE